MVQKKGIRKILFIGSFVLPKNGSFGGVYFASSTIKSSLDKRNIEVIELDTTVEDINKMGLTSRLHKVIFRNGFFYGKFSPAGRRKIY